MSTSIQRGICAILFSSICFCGAEPPSGLVTLSFDSTTAPVWDLSGSLLLEQQMVGAGEQETPIGFAVEVTHDGRGKLSGSGFTLLNVGNDFVAANYTVKGSTSGGGDKINRANFTVKLTGEDVIAGVNTTFNVTIKYKLEADADQLAFTGTASGSASFSGLSSAKVRSDVTMPLPANVDGSWVLNMNIVALNKLSGSADIVFPTGRSLHTQLSGSYSSSSGISKIKMSGLNESKGTSLTLRLFSGEEGFEIDSMKGKILGQTVRQ